MLHWIHVVSVLVFLILVVFATVAVAAKQPNVLLILADDVGVGDISVYNEQAEKLVQTPNIDELASQGVRFTNFYATPLCAPTRYAILSGRYSTRATEPMGIWNVFDGKSAFDKNQESLATTLGRAGFHTAFFGKWHLGGKIPPSGCAAGLLRTGCQRDVLNSTSHNWNSPLLLGAKHLGFNYSWLSPGGIQDAPFVWFKNDNLQFQGYSLPDDQQYFVQTKSYENSRGFSQVSHSGAGLPYWESNTYGEELIKRTRDFLDMHDRSNSGKPFYIHYASQAVHIPHTPPVQFFNDPVMNQTRTYHLDMVVELDLQVKALLSELKNRNQLDDTVVIFVSDNGGLRLSSHVGHNTSAGRRGAKGNLYDGGFRVPAIISYPRGGIKVNRVFDGLASITDLFRTITDLVGVKVPASQATDSISLHTQLLGFCPESSRKELYTYNLNKGEVVRAEDWKLLHFVEAGTYELYNLADDPGEENNLAESNPTMVAKLKPLLQKYQPGQNQPFEVSTCPKVKSGSCETCKFSTKEKLTCCLGSWLGLCGGNNGFSWSDGIAACDKPATCECGKNIHGKKSCCFKGGSWHGTCQNNPNTWKDGFAACNPMSRIADNSDPDPELMLGEFTEEYSGGLPNSTSSSPFIVSPGCALQPHRGLLVIVQAILLLLPTVSLVGR